MQFIKETHIDFIGLRKVGFILSATLILAGLLSLIIRGGINYGIDFTGGTSLQIRFEKPVQIGDVRTILTSIGLGNAEIKEFSTGNELLIRVQQLANMEDPSDKLIEAFKQKLPDNPLEIRQKESVGPRIGNELRRAAIWAVLVSLGLILIYISYRFEFKFAIGAVVALFHDVLITLSFFSWLNLEFTLSVLAAFLTIVGYSLNDTIVVYDRIRENLKIMRKDDMLTIFNTSINQTLSRTVLTGSTTLMVVIILYFFGGEVLHNFSFAMIVGMIVGTYSSIFVASPIVVVWYSRTEGKKSKLSRR
ncbi:MAG: protein translocase subunit SecF [Candidatus Zhuqueibacterota bacterium]